MSLSKPYSEKTAEEIDAEVKRLIDEAHETAKRVLSEHRAAFEALAQLLLEREVIFSEDVERILGPRTAGVNPNAIIGGDTSVEGGDMKPAGPAAEAPSAAKDAAPTEEVKPAAPEKEAVPETPVTPATPAAPAAVQAQKPSESEPAEETDVIDLGIAPVELKPAKKRRKQSKKPVAEQTAPSEPLTGAEAQDKPGQDGHGNLPTLF